MNIDICNSFKSGVTRLFSCDKVGEFVRVRTPFLYPDGDYIDVFCKEQSNVTLVTDLGETARWLRMQTTSPRRSVKQRALLEDVCQTHGLEFYRGALIARCRVGDDLAEVVTRVAQGSLRVSDLWFTFRTRSVESVVGEVADFLVEQSISFSQGEKRQGRSGRVWKPDFYVRETHRSSMVFVLSTGSKSASKNIVNHVHTAFSDLNMLSAGPEAVQFISLFDDTLDVWSEEDFNLADQISTVARWSEPERFADLLKEAA